MLIRTMHGAPAQDEQVAAPSVNFGEMTLASQQDSSFVARLLATRALRTWTDAGAVPIE